MRFRNILCYFIITVTVAVSCVGADNRPKELILENRRDLILMIESPINRSLHNPKILYRRQSPRYGPPRSRYGGTRSRYRKIRPKDFRRKPSKKITNHKKPTSSNYFIPKKESKNNFRYTHPSKSRSKPKLKITKKPTIKPFSYTAPEAAGFAEPPTNYVHDYPPTKQTYGEPPVDSYGAPLKLNTEPQSFHENGNNYHSQAFPPWADIQDINAAYSNKHTAFSKPDFDDEFQTPIYDEQDDSDEIEVLRKVKSKKKFKKKRVPYDQKPFGMFNSPLKLKKPGDAEIIVGGQYAEPPPRFVSRWKPGAPMADDDEDPFSPVRGYVGRDVGSSAASSPYVNYKNSNMAFSPQNLNDAFSIVDN